MARFARHVLIAATLVALVAALMLLAWWLAEVWLLMFAGLLLAVFLRGLIRPLVGYLHLPNVAAFALVLIVVVLGAVATLLVFVPLFGEGIAALREGLPGYLERIGEQLERYAWGRDLLDSVAEVDWGSYLAVTFSRLAGFFSNAFGMLMGFVLILVTGLYLAVNPNIYVSTAMSLVPLPGRPRAAQILKELHGAMEWWLVGRILSMAVIGVLTWFALLALKIPYAATLAFLAALLSFIPNVGPVLSALPAILIGAAMSPVIGFYVTLAYILVQVVESYVITPVVQRSTVDLPPATGLIMQIAFTALYGFLGLLLAVPLTVAFIVLIKTIYIEDILGDRNPAALKSR